MLRFTTATGATYDVDLENSFWRKREGSWQRLWGAPQAGKVKAFPWEAPDDWFDRLPVEGEHLFVTSRDLWWVSTPVVSIEEIPSTLDSE